MPKKTFYTTRANDAPIFCVVMMWWYRLGWAGVEGGQKIAREREKKKEEKRKNFFCTLSFLFKKKKTLPLNLLSCTIITNVWSILFP